MELAVIGLIISAVGAICNVIQLGMQITNSKQKIKLARTCIDKL